MGAIFKDKVLLYSIVLLAFGALFFLWRRQESMTDQMIEQTKVMVEITEQTKDILDNPIKKEIIYPRTITEREVIEDGKVVEKTKTIESEGSLKLTDYKDLPGREEDLGYFVWGNYDGGFTGGIGIDIKSVSVGVGLTDEYKGSLLLKWRF